jgi:ACS family hexuronate transporter-like MFS transporter
MSEPVLQRSASWKWWICGLLLFASTINYMDRQTLANAAVRITTQFHLNQEQYGNLELVFGWAFAVGSLCFGIVVDRISVRWVYPVVLLLWSGTGFATGLTQSYGSLLLCRTLLGFFEAGHWPCAIKTTQRLLSPQDRAMGNGVLQSGTSIGAVITPLVMQAMMTEEVTSWRFTFQAIGLIGLGWILAWFVLVRKHDLSPVAPRSPAQAGLQRGDLAVHRAGSGWADAPGSMDPTTARGSASIWRVVFSRRMMVVLLVVACINTCWQILRAWLPKLLIEGRGYAEADALYFNSLFYVASDVGCLGAGALVLWLAHRGMSLHGSRFMVFFGSALLAALTTVAAVLPHGWLLLGVLLLVGVGALGVFPIYHALTQDLSVEHQGKVTGIAGIAAWGFSPVQKYYGRLVDQTGSFDLGLALVGGLPLAAFLFLWLLWGEDEAKNSAC